MGGELILSEHDRGQADREQHGDSRQPEPPTRVIRIGHQLRPSPFRVDQQRHLHTQRIRRRREIDPVVHACCSSDHRAVSIGLYYRPCGRG